MKFKGLNEGITNIKNDNVRLTTENNQLKLDLAVLKRVQIPTLDLQIKKIQEEKNTSQKKKNDLISRLSNVNETLKEMKREREFLTENGKKLEDKVKEMEESKEADYYENVVKINELEELISQKDKELETRPNITKEDFEKMNNSLTKLKKTAEENDLVTSGLRAEVARMQEERKLEKELVVAFEKQKAELEQDLKDANDKLTSMGETESENIKLQKKKIDEITKQLKTTQEILIKSQESLASTDERLLKTEKRVNELNAELMKKEDELRDLKINKIGELEGKVKFLEKQSLNDKEREVLSAISKLKINQKEINDLDNL